MRCFASRRVVCPEALAEVEKPGGEVLPEDPDKLPEDVRVFRGLQEAEVGDDADVENLRVRRVGDLLLLRLLEEQGWGFVFEGDGPGLDSGGEVRGPDGFGEVVVHAGGKGLFPVALHGVGGHGDYRGASGGVRFPAANLPCRLIPAHAGHLYVHEYKGVRSL
nr:hypothetical protein [Rubrobacter indicoceani]